MAKIKCICEICGETFYRNPSAVHEHTLCSRECSRKFCKQRMSRYNTYENPMNRSEGWCQEKREAVRKREQRNKGICGKNTYPKFHGRHEHRVVAEQILGRKLKPGEVVHHIDENRHNNSPENLMIFPNQQAHAEYHQRLKKEGDANG